MTDKLTEPEVRKKFFLSLHNKFEALRHLGKGEVDTISSSIRNTFNDLAKEVIGRKKRRKDWWISDKTWGFDP